MEKNPTKFRELSDEEMKEVLEQFHSGAGAEFMVNDIENFIEEALRFAEEVNATVSLEIFNGIYTLRRVMRLLRYLDPYAK